jgi:alpha-methylacyl-CoA racemase
VAGHDINYLSVAGALHGLGQDSRRPQFPANLLGDFGGGSTYLVIGVLAALFEARSSGLGQVVDAAIVDGTAHLSAMYWGLLESGSFTEERGANLLDGGAPFYDIYETADGRHLAVGALEPKFFATFIQLLGVEDECPDQHDTARYPEMRRLFGERIASRPMAEWAEVFDGTDACVTAVLRPREAVRHPQNAARGTFFERDGRTEPAPAPRFSRTATRVGLPPSRVGAGTREALKSWGIEDVESLIASGAAVQG